MSDGREDDQVQMSGGDVGAGGPGGSAPGKTLEDDTTPAEHAGEPVDTGSEDG